MLSTLFMFLGLALTSQAPQDNRVPSIPPFEGGPIFAPRTPPARTVPPPTPTPKKPCHWFSAICPEIQQPGVQAQPQPAKPAMPKPKSANSELREALTFLTNPKKVNPLDAPYLRFFTFYNLSDKPQHTITLNKEQYQISTRQAGLLTLSFVLNSCAHVERSQGLIVTPQLVPGSDTLCYINILDYGWSAKQWDEVSKADPYIVEPLIDHNLYTLGRIISGNVMFRGDWFIANAMDPQRQIEAKIPQLLYYTLLFEDKIPKTGKEFEQALRVNTKVSIATARDRRTVIEAGSSGVSIDTGGNRKIEAIRTEDGYFYETFDTRVQDYLNNPDDDNREAGEYIASHKNGTQVYLLVNDKNARVEVADNGLVDDRRRGTVVPGDALSIPVDRRVHTAVSCVWCHEGGINAIRNDFIEGINEGVPITFIDQLIKGNYGYNYDYNNLKNARDKLNNFQKRYINNSLNEVIEEDNRIYARAVWNCNGLSGLDNAQLFTTLINLYNSHIGIEEASAECGVSKIEYTLRTEGSISARINRIVASDKFKIPRRYWDSFNPAGDYATSILTIRLNSPEEVKASLAAYHNPYAAVAANQIVIAVDCYVMVTVNGVRQKLGVLTKNQQVDYIKKEGDWYLINYGSVQGYVYKGYCK